MSCHRKLGAFVFDLKRARNIHALMRIVLAIKTQATALLVGASERRAEKRAEKRGQAEKREKRGHEKRGQAKKWENIQHLFLFCRLTPFSRF